MVSYSGKNRVLLLVARFFRRVLQRIGLALALTANGLGLAVEIFFAVFGRVGGTLGVFLGRLGLVFEAVGAVFEAGFARLLFL